MKVICLIENLEKNASLFTKIIPTNTQIPILQNVLLEAKEENFFISAVDTEIGIKIKIPAKVEKVGRITVPGRQFFEATASLPKDKLEIEVDKESLSLKTREYSLSFQTQAADEFPDPFSKKPGKKTEIEKEMLKKINKKLVFATAQDEARPEITGVLLLQKEAGVELVATDGYRLSLWQSPAIKIGEKGERLILSRRLLEEAGELKTEKEKIDLFVAEDAAQVFFETETAALVGRLIGGKFPSYEKIIPTSFKTKLEVDKEELLRAVRLLSVFSKDSANIVKVKIESGRLLLSAAAQGLGKGDIGIEIETEGQENQISFNPRFLMDFIKSCDGQKISLEVNSAIEPALFREVGKEDFLHIIMPVRLQE